MTEACKTVDINGTRYVRGDLAELAAPLDGKPYVIVRTYSAGCFAGYLERREGKGGRLLLARRLWHWEGAASLSELAVHGSSAPAKCLFPAPTPWHELTEIIEVIGCTEAGRASIQGVPVWSR